MFFHRKALSVSSHGFARSLNCSSEEHADSSGFCTNQINRITALRARLLKGICLFAGSYQEMHMTTYRHRGGLRKFLVSGWVRWSFYLLGQMIHDPLPAETHRRFIPLLLSSKKSAASDSWGGRGEEKQKSKESRKEGWALFAGEILAGGLGVISLELEILCSHLQGGDGKDWGSSEQPWVSRGVAVSLPGSPTALVRCKSLGLEGQSLSSLEGGNGNMSPGGPWDPQSSEIQTHLRHRNRLILIGNKGKANLLPWVQKHSFI